jgi:hypothetical protein
VAFLCGEGGACITGATLDVNGGMYMHWSNAAWLFLGFIPALPLPMLLQAAPFAASPPGTIQPNPCPASHPCFTNDGIQEMFVDFWHGRDRLADVRSVKPYLLADLPAAAKCLEKGHR